MSHLSLWGVWTGKAYPREGHWLLGDTFPGMDYVPALSKMPTKCTRVLAHLFVVGHTSFQNTVFFLLSFGESCLMLPIFRSLFAHCLWWGVCLQPLKTLFVFSFHFLNIFFSFFPAILFSLTNCEACTRLSLRYFKRAQHSLNRRFSNAFLLSVQGHMIRYIYILSDQLGRLLVLLLRFWDFLFFLMGL